MASAKNSSATLFMLILVAVGASASTASGSCPTKLGFTAVANATFTVATGADDSSGITSGMRPSAAEAEEFCWYEPRCSSWDTRGGYTVGPVQGIPQAAAGVCSYLRNPCPSLKGFTAYADKDVDTAPLPARERLGGKCLLDVYKACLADPDCRAFNKMRYVWAATHTAADIASHLTDLPGSCVFVKSS